MKTILYPGKPEWDDLCLRPEIDKADLEGIIHEIISRVKLEKDKAIYGFTEKFDGIKVDELKVSASEISESSEMVSKELKKAIQTALSNIKIFHKAQLIEEPAIETTKGVSCWRKNLPIEKVGLYIPGGSAPLFSTVLYFPGYASFINPFLAMSLKTSGKIALSDWSERFKLLDICL